MNINRMSASHRLLKVCRLMHLYLGVFTAPALLFFAITGGLQTFNLHEAGRGSSYVPPRWLAVMAQLHKKQTPDIPVHRPRPAMAPAPLEASTAIARPRSSQQAPRRHPLPLKIFVAVVALALALSSLSGLYMAWRYTRHAWRIAAIFLAGIIVPVLLALI